MRQAVWKWAREWSIGQVAILKGRGILPHRLACHKLTRIENVYTDTKRRTRNWRSTSSSSSSCCPFLTLLIYFSPFFNLSFRLNCARTTNIFWQARSFTHQLARARQLAPACLLLTFAGALILIRIRILVLFLLSSPLLSSLTSSLSPALYSLLVSPPDYVWSWLFSLILSHLAPSYFLLPVQFGISVGVVSWSIRRQATQHIKKCSFPLQFESCQHQLASRLLPLYLPAFLLPSLSCPSSTESACCCKLGFCS